MVLAMDQMIIWDRSTAGTSIYVISGRLCRFVKDTTSYNRVNGPTRTHWRLMNPILQLKTPTIKLHERMLKQGERREGGFRHQSLMIEAVDVMGRKGEGDNSTAA